MNAPKHPRWKRTIAGSIWAVAVCAALFALLRPAPAAGDGTGLQIGARAPDFTLKTQDGQAMKLSDLKGRPVIINFWATWCPPCRAEMPDLEAAYQANKEQGLEILAVNMGEAKVAIDAFRDKVGITFPVLVDENSRVTKAYDVIPLPTTYFVDAQGVIRGKQSGQLRPEDIKRYLNKIMPGGDVRG